MFYISLKYMYILFISLHVLTKKGHLQETLFFQGICRTAHNATRTETLITNMTKIRNLV
jgi:hypothetical protein